MPEIELHQLDRPYGRLRIASRTKASRLLSSLAIEGQQAPVLVTAKAGGGGYVLVDGYQRVGALEALGRDTVWAQELELDETAALVFCHRQRRSRRWSVLEEAWLLQELLDHRGLDQGEAAERLGHTKSWVSRRLALVRVLPERVQELVRRGELGPHSTMKYLRTTALLAPLQARQGACARERATRSSDLRQGACNVAPLPGVSPPPAGVRQPDQPLLRVISSRCARHESCPTSGHGGSSSHRRGGLLRSLAQAPTGGLSAALS